MNTGAHPPSDINCGAGSLRGRVADASKADEKGTKGNSRSRPLKVHPLLTPPGKDAQRPGIKGQYVGDYKGGVWNSQALMAALMHSREDKLNYILKLMRHRDFLGVTETHGTAGEVENISLPINLKGFWSPGSTSQAGIGIAIKKEFLDRFRYSVPFLDPVVPGRLGVLRLSGEQGDLDIWVAYFPTGTREKKARW